MLLVALGLTACGEPEDTRPGQPVAHRRAAFKEVLKVTEPMGVMLRDETTFDAKRFATLAQRLNAVRDGPWGYFGDGTQYPPSHAKDDVWNDPAKFAAAKQSFFDATDRLAAVAGKADEAQAVMAYGALENTCRNCHKAFKRD